MVSEFPSTSTVSSFFIMPKRLRRGSSIAAFSRILYVIRAYLKKKLNTEVFSKKNHSSDIEI